MQILALVEPLGQPQLDSSGAPTVQREDNKSAEWASFSTRMPLPARAAPRLAREGHAVDVGQLRAKLGQAREGRVELAGCRLGQRGSEQLVGERIGLHAPRRLASCFKSS